VWLGIVSLSSIEMDDVYDGELNAVDDSNDGDGPKWILIALGVAIGVMLCVVTACCVRRRRETKKEAQRDDVELRSDEQLKSVDAQMIELEESVEDRPEVEDGDATTIEMMA